jgi:hypothetical protein
MATKVALPNSAAQRWAKIELAPATQPTPTAGIRSGIKLNNIRALSQLKGHKTNKSDSSANIRANLIAPAIPCTFGRATSAGRPGAGRMAGWLDGGLLVLAQNPGGFHETGTIRLR